MSSWTPLSSIQSGINYVFGQKERLFCKEVFKIYFKTTQLIVEWENYLVSHDSFLSKELHGQAALVIA